MSGGEILIDGNAGNEVGHTLRRGLIAVRGQAGDAIGFNLLAGSIFVFGRAGVRPGAAMRRGTIALFERESPPLLPTFAYACTGRFDFLRVFLSHLVRSGFDVPDDFLDATWRRYSGDLLESGKGEILLREPG
jgi:formylmethanofuran dehydrogenase subunit C